MQVKNLKTYLAWGVFFAYHVLVVYVAVLPAGRLRPLDVGDKYLHLAEFFVLGILSFWAFGQKKQSLVKETLFLKWLSWGVFMAVVTECLQLMVPGRFADIYDVLANTLGYIIAAATIYLFDKLILKTSYRPIEG